MKKLLNLTFALFFCLSTNAQTKVIKIDALQRLINQKDGSIQVINFWATWCGPCVKELPFFEKLNTSTSLAKVTLINLDFVEKLDRVDAFIARKKIKNEVLLLDEIDYNSWIEKVDKSWTGSIPATLIYNPENGKRAFTQQELKEGELEKLIESVKQTKN